MSGLTGLQDRLPLNVLLQVHVTLLISTFVFIGFSQIALAAGESDPRENFKGYISHLDARRLLLMAMTVGGFAALASLATLIFEVLGGFVVTVISASFVIVEIMGLLILLWQTFLSLKRS